MKPRYSSFAFFIALLVVLAGFSSANALVADGNPDAHQGKIDLTKADMTHALAHLRGEWTIIPLDSNGAPSGEGGVIRVPDHWNGLLYRGKKLGGQGVFLYRLEVLLPAPGRYVMRVGEVDTAWELFIDGKIVDHSRGFSLSPVNAGADWERHYSAFTAASNVVRVEFRVANWKHRLGGIDDTPLIGTEMAAQKYRIGAIGQQLFIAGAIFVVILYHLFIFLFRRSEVASLLFSLSGVAIITRILITGEKILVSAYPVAGWEFWIRVEYISFVLILPLFISFFSRQIPKLMPMALEKFYWGISIPVVAAFLVLPSLWITWVPPFFQLVIIITALYIMARVSWLTIRGLSGGAFLTTGFLVLLTSVIWDALVYYGILDAPYALHWGMGAFVLFQAIYLTWNYAGTFRQMEKLGKELEKKNREVTTYASVLKEESDEQISMLFSAIDQLGESLIITDIEGKIEYVNRKFTEVTGYSSEEIIGKNPNILKSEQTPHSAYRYLWQSISAGREWRGEFHNRRKNGELYWEYATIAPVRNREGKISHYIAAKEDISDRKQIEEVLSAQRKEISQRNLTLEKDLEMARKIQKQLIPESSPDRRISFFWHPMEKVGGDLYDFIIFREPGVFGIFISDVSGHGMQAALITAMVKSLVSSADERRYDPSAMLGYLNDRLFAQTQDLFVTALYAVVDLKERKILLSSAGHNDPWLITPQKVGMISPAKKSPPLAVFSNKDLKENRRFFEKSIFNVEPGSRLLFYTDGLTECIPVDGRTNVEYIDGGLRELLKKSANLGPVEMLNQVYLGVKNYRGSDRFEDDIYLVAVEL